MSDDVGHAGHRERLRQRLLSGDVSSQSDEALLELLLTYATPRRDVQPLARALLLHFGCLDITLAASADDLYRVGGLKPSSVALLKAVHAICSRTKAQRLAAANPSAPVVAAESQHGSHQEVILEILATAETRNDKKNRNARCNSVPRRGTELFGKALLKEAVQMLPRLPDSKSLDDAREFLRKNLHFSAEATRRRNAAYITRRLFLDGIADQALRVFGKAYASTPELKEACFYRFCKAEPLMQNVMTDLFLPALGMGRLRRDRILRYLQTKFPESKSTSDCTQAIVDALVAGGIATADRKQVSYSGRTIRAASFAFILHSEFPEPGIHDIDKAETNRLLSCMLWTPERILAALYELRNEGLISKISEIDSVRQFTLRFDLMGVVNHLARGDKTA